MVHARMFSFTDDSINVAFPNTSNIGRKPSKTGPIPAPQSADPALLLFQLRRAQSFWYQELYQSDSTPLANPSAFIWQMCLQMREWGDSLPNTLSPGVRQMFDQELRYSYVYCIAPSTRAPQITEYDRTLIFEYSLTYLNTMNDIANGGFSTSLYTYHDALKVYFMANQFLAVLSDAADMLLSGAQIPMPAVAPGSAPPPPLPKHHVHPGSPADDNLERSLYCIERIPQTLEKYGERWEDAMMLKQSFERISQDMIEQLYSRRQMRGPPLQQSPNQYQNNISLNAHVSPQMQPQSQQQQQQQQHAVQWTGIDPSQMLPGHGR